MRKATLCLAAVIAASSSLEAGAAPNAFQDAVMADGPALYYQLNEASGSAINLGSLGPDYNATYFGTSRRAVATSSGDAGVFFDSQDDYLESEAVAPMAFGGNPTFTAEALVWLPANTSVFQYAPLLHWGVSDATPTMKSAYFSFRFTDPMRFYAGFYNGGLYTVAPVDVAKWHHVVWVRTGGGAANQGSILYVDGDAVELQDDSLLIANASTPAIVPARFRINRAQDLTRYFTGTLDEVALYDYALDPEAVMTHYQALDICPLDNCLDDDGVCKRCAHPVSTNLLPSATDALAILGAAVGTRSCALCVCDVNGSGNILGSDALIALRSAVGVPIELTCPAE